MQYAIANHQRVPITITRGKGCYLYDNHQRRYLDFMGGWCVGTVGWGNAAMAKAISQQVQQQFFTVASFILEPQERLAQTLIKLAPGKMARVYRVTSGSEAVEMAMKCARVATGKKVIISFAEVYHGHTYGAASVGSALTSGMQPGITGVEKLPLPTSADLAAKVLVQLEQRLRHKRDVAAVLTEPVWTNAGCYIPPADFFPQVQKLCRRYGVLLVMDEVACGIGRCGTLFASELWGLQPDIITLGKALTGGYATLGATLVTEAVYKKSKHIPHYSTFGWRLTDCIATLENLRLIQEQKLVQNSAKVGAYLLAQLQPLLTLRKVKMLRGQGLLIGVQFKLPLAPQIALKCYRRGLLVEFTDLFTLYLSPPLVLSRAQAKAGADIIKAACGI
ncbi:MAG: aspartate aminotransferase family protein [Candidatus Kerfeldbacteria bacterium]|nr:aspartate aminotransferase family protein [Candidatus Kerfeldbacteria bacterium]